MSNHEKKDYAECVDVLLAFKRKKDGGEHRTMRQVIKDYEVDLALLEYKCKIAGGIWRIHCTVNHRDTEKARKWLLHKLIDFPEGAGFVDALWRTALLQPENVYGVKNFLLDIDTKDEDKLSVVDKLIEPFILIKKIETPGGWHYLTFPFDTREVCQLPHVSLQRDGYYFIKKIGEENGI